MKRVAAAIVGVLPTALFVMCAVCASCARCESAAPGVPAATVAARPNILLVTIDTLRHDHLACHGHPRVKTPAIDRLTRDRELVVTAATARPRTEPAHASIVTRLTRGVHRIRRSGDFLGEGRATLAEILRDAGHAMARIINGYPLPRRFGAAQGFDTHVDRLVQGETSAGKFAGKRENVAPDVAESAVAWIREYAHTQAAARAAADVRRAPLPPLSAWAHFFDPDAPYEPPASFDRADHGGDPRDPRHTGLAGAGIPSDVRTHLAGITDRVYSITLVDFAIERALAVVEYAWLLDNTLVAITAGHRESLSANGYYSSHKDIVDENNLRVPLIVKRLAAASARGLDALATTATDLFAFLSDAAGVGRAASPTNLIAGEAAPEQAGASRVVFTEQDIYKSGPRGADTYVASRYVAHSGARTLVSNTAGAEATRADAAALNAEVVETLNSLGYVDH